MKLFERPDWIEWRWLGVALVTLVAACGDDTGEPDPVSPSTPMIQSLAATGLPAAPGKKVTVEIVAQSPDELDLGYTWTLEGEGWSFTDGVSSATVTLIAPDQYDASAALRVAVTDSRNGTATGLLTLTTTDNTAPVIHNLSVSANPSRRNQLFEVLVAAEDPNGDLLSYEWTAPAGIHIENGQGTPEATLRGLATTNGVVEVVVSDGHGGTAAGRIHVTAINGAWQAAKLIETDDAGNAEVPQIGVGSDGNAVAVWRQYDGARWTTRANRYNPGSGWGHVRIIGTDDGGDADDPQVAIDPDGNALAIWRQHDGTRWTIRANRYTVGRGWGDAEPIETNDTGSAYGPQVGFDVQGNALAVWHQWDGSRHNIWANRYTAGSGWGTAELIETNDAGHARDPQIAFDPTGNALAVWRQSDGLRDQIWANRYIAGSGWETAQQIETNEDGDAQTPQIGLDAQGNALAVWSQSDGSRSHIWTNRYTAGSGWGTAERIETSDSGNAYGPQVAFDAQGHATVAWRHADVAFVIVEWNVGVIRETADGGWGSAEFLQPHFFGVVGGPQIAVDAQGNAVVIWRQTGSVVEPQGEIWTNRYTAGSGWGTSVRIHAPDDGSATDPQIAVDAQGNALAVWRQDDGSRWNIRANRFE